MHAHFHKHISKKKQLSAVNKAMMVAAFLHPMTGLPQVIEIYSTQNADSVSLATWVGFMMFGLLYLYYAILHKLKPLIVTQILWFIVDLLVIVGALIYR